MEILPGGPNAQVMVGVATGRADLGMTNGDDVIVDVARGKGKVQPVAGGPHGT